LEDTSEILETRSLWRFICIVQLVSVHKCFVVWLIALDFLWFISREVDKRIVDLPEIRETGEYIAELKLHPEVTAKVKVNVLANWAALICFKVPYAKCTIA